MKKLTTLLFAGLLSLALFSQTDPRIARTKAPLSDVPVALMPHLDNEALLAAELERRGPGIAPRFAEAIEVSISPATHGQWVQLSNGNALWRMRIRSAGAKSINLGFTKYGMPDRGSLILYSPDYQTVMGPFTPADNEEHEQLWTPILPSDELVMEVQVPAHSQSALQLELKYVNHDFIGFMEMASGSCNLDVICGAADGWGIVDAYRDIIQSVAVIGTGGTTFCTGFLVNNARQDCTPYFMTANHCGISAGQAPSLVAYWNFFNSTCRQPNSPASGGNGNGLLNDFNTGSILRATLSSSDFTLVELDDPVSETADAFFAGWSAEDFAPTDTVICIHHPNTDEKRISFEFQPTFVADYNSTTPNPNGTHITVPDWDIGTTEGGSSGSPLFNRQKRVVGQLHGGFAACGNNLQDSYGWFYRSWTGGGTANTSLKPWLDPDNTGIVVLDGRSQLQCSYFVEASPASQSLCAPADAVYTITVSPNFTADVTLSLANLPAGLTATFGANPVAPGGTTTLTLSGTASIAEGNYDFTLEGTDGTESNSSGLTLFVAAQVPAAPSPLSPIDGAGSTALSPIFTWTTIPGATYSIEIASDTAFANIIESATNLTAASYQLGAVLPQTTTYYWRVRGTNVCGQGNWNASPSSFTTGAVTCAPVSSTEVPVTISTQGNITVTSTLTVSGGGFVDDINIVNLNIQHTWVGDLQVQITSPSGTSVALFSTPGDGNCSGNDLQLSFDDEATLDYATFDQTCNPTAPAIQGSYQPLSPLNAFDGEPITGVWTLSVTDVASQDGGALLSWGLDLCSTIPNDFSVSPSGNAFTTCVGTDLNFNLFLGNAFDDASGVTLTAENLPPGATATFDPNPAQPGTQVAVTVSGAASAGDFTFDVVATDGLSNTGTAAVQWGVQGAPPAPLAISPAQNATNVNVNTVFSWSATGASYSFNLATDPGMTNLVFNTTPTQPAQVVNGLAPCNTYYWTVTSETACGISDPLEVFSFTTVDDLTFNITQASVVSCPTGSANVVLSVGDCFGPNGVTVTASGLPTGASFSLIQNPVPAGSSPVLSLSLINVASGSYTITLTGNDGVHTVTETFILNVTALAAAPTLVVPANAATDVNVLAAFDWNTVAGATGYLLEVATDANFSNIAFSTTTTQSNYTLTTPLNVNTTYFWRVIASNNCGPGNLPTPFSFTTWPVNSTTELNGLTVSVSPNPTSGQVSAIFSKTTEENIDATLYSVNGILVGSQPVGIGRKSVTFDLSELPAGVYLLRLRSASGVLTKKIVLEK